MVDRFGAENLLVHVAVWVKEQLNSIPMESDILWREAETFNKIFNLLSLILSRKEGNPCKKFHKNTPSRPHIDLMTVPYAKCNLRRSIISGLDVSVFRLIFEATRTKVNYFNA